MLTTKKDLAITIFKALSIYSIIQALGVVAYRLPFLFNNNDFEYNSLIIIQILASSLLLVIGALAIWYLSPVLVESIFHSTNVDEEHRLSSHDFHRVAFSAIGLFTIVDALPGIAYTTLFYYQIMSLSNIDKGIIAERNSSLISLLLQTGLGLWLLFGSRGIVKYVRLRENNSDVSGTSRRE